jgi:hypothetical protein
MIINLYLPIDSTKSQKVSRYVELLIGNRRTFHLNSEQVGSKED